MQKQLNEYMIPDLTNIIMEYQEELPKLPYLNDINTMYHVLNSRPMFVNCDSAIAWDVFFYEFDNICTSCGNRQNTIHCCKHIDDVLSSYPISESLDD